MAEVRERSGLFKFFYIILRVLTFPIYAVLFVLRHPLLFVLVLAVAAGAVVYFPLSEGVEFANIPEWYKNRYTQTKLEVVSKAVESGQTGFIPEAMLNDAQEMQKKLAVDAEEAKRVKGENYNEKLTRDYDAEEDKNRLKNRRGFKKAKSEAAVQLSDDEQELVDAVLPTVEAEDAADESATTGVGGLADILKKKKAVAETEEVISVEETQAEEETAAKQESAPDENKPALQTNDVKSGQGIKKGIKTEPKAVEKAIEKPQPQPAEAVDDADLDFF